MSVRFVGLALIAALLLGLGAAPAWAEDPGDDAAKPAAEGEDEGALAFAEFDKIYEEQPGVFWFVMLSRYGALLIGLVLVVLLYLRYDKIRGGVLPMPAKTPPTEVFEPSTSLLVAVAGVLVLPFLVSTVVVEAIGRENFTTVYQILVMGACSLPVAAIVVLRRNRLASPKPPRMPKPIGVGLGAFCVATVFVVPLTLLTVLVMQSLGKAAPVQQLVQQTIESPDDTLPIVIALYGVLIAPFAEEAIFRGLLYPAFKRWMGGTRRAAVLSGIGVSLIFAAVHASAVAFAGLFALALVLTFVYERTNSLAAVVIAHATNNFLSLAPLLMLRFGS